MRASVPSAARSHRASPASFFAVLMASCAAARTSELATASMPHSQAAPSSRPGAARAIRYLITVHRIPGGESHQAEIYLPEKQVLCRVEGRASAWFGRSARNTERGQEKPTERY